MRALAVLAAALLALPLAAPAAAQEAGAFSAGSQAKSWNLVGEQKARFTAKVVDVLCELTGDCPADCGAGKRHLGLVREADGALVFVNKNGQPAFSGPGADLLPYCGARVEVDGLLVGEDEANPATRVFQLQLIRRVGEEKFARANRWTRQWNAAHPELAKQKGPWFRKDPRILRRIARDGYLGLGPEADKEFIEYYFDE